MKYGHEKDKQKKPVFNYSIACDKKSRLPLFWEAYPGSINDVSRLKFMLDKAKAYGYNRIMARKALDIRIRIERQEKKAVGGAVGRSKGSVRETAAGTKERG